MTVITPPTHHPEIVSQSHWKTQGGRRGRLLDILGVLALVVGALGLAWPWASVMWSHYTASATIDDQHAIIEQLSPEQRASELQRAVDYNNSLTGKPVKDPFISGSGYALPSDDAYMAALNVNNDGIMGSVDVDMLDIHLPIAHGTSEEVLTNNAGHDPESSLPIGGLGTHSVIAAHRGLVHAEMFTRLGEMNIGDTFEIHVLGETHAYQVDQISIVKPDDLSKIAIEPDRDLVTLMTCTPYGINTQRLLVRGTRISSADASESHHSWGIEHMVRVACAIVGLILMLILIIWLVVWMMCYK